MQDSIARESLDGVVGTEAFPEMASLLRSQTDRIMQRWDGEARDVQQVAENLSLAQIHMASPHMSFDAVVQDTPTAGGQVQLNSQMRREESHIINRFAVHCPVPVLLVGDFNTPVESNIYRQYWSGFRDSEHLNGPVIRQFDTPQNHYIHAAKMIYTDRSPVLTPRM